MFFSCYWRWTRAVHLGHRCWRHRRIHLQAMNLRGNCQAHRQHSTSPASDRSWGLRQSLLIINQKSRCRFFLLIYLTSMSSGHLNSTFLKHSSSVCPRSLTLHVHSSLEKLVLSRLVTLYIQSIIAVGSSYFRFRQHLSQRSREQRNQLPPPQRRCIQGRTELPEKLINHARR